MPLRTQQFQPLLTQANIHRLRGQWDAATDACIAVLRAQPNNRHAHSLLGDIYRDQGKIDDAKQWYRMALELEPNPNDERKLRLLESGKALRRIAPPATGLLPSKTDLALHTGTTPLLNLSPRRWLRGITVASVAFLGLVILGLGILQVRNSRAPKPAASTTTGFLSDPTALQRLSRMTPARAGSEAAVSARSTPSAPASSSSGDSGFAPDQPRVSPNAPLQQLMKKAQRPKLNASARPEVAVARPLDVQPLPAPSPNTNMDAGFAQSGMSGLKPAPAPDAFLPGGLRVRRVDKDPASGTARLFVAAPASFAANLNASSRDVLVRGAFRAARSVARADDRIGRLDVLLSVPGSGAETGLLEITLDATAAMNADLTASADTLTAQTVALRWLAALPNDGSGETPSVPGNP